MTKSRFDKLLPSKSKAKAEPKRDEKVKLVETRQVEVTRTVGKRSKDDYTQVSAYILKDTHLQVKAALIGDTRDFSELVEQLLTDWLSTHDGK